MDPNDYEGREQVYVKHFVLKHYLESLAFKVGQFRPGTTLNYIDGFSGPWEAGRPDLGDSSPAIAMKQLAAVRDKLAGASSPVPMQVRCMFVEKDPAAYSRLSDLCRAAPDIEAHALRGEFESHIPEAVAFATEGTKPFAFIFIDPKGWTGYPMTAITPLLRVGSSEVLINFMLKDILRFIDHEDSVALGSFEDLFGQRADEYRTRWGGLTGLDREDAIVRAYEDRIREVGGFGYCTSTVVVNPRADRTHYHLVYATRSRKGLVTFREIEHRAMMEQRQVRATAKRDARESRRGQTELFAPEAMDTPYLEMLRERYAERAQESASKALGPVGGEVTYETLVDAALRWPMTTEQDLKGWIAEWQKEGRVALVGLRPKARTPQLSARHGLRRLR